MSFNVFSIAPMLKRTDRHCRYFFRLIYPDIHLYTEMVTTGAIIFGNQKRHLDFHPKEHPIALQLGGSDPEALAKCAKIGEDWGYQEINLNVGCPSERVQSGTFGACLMKAPGQVADCVEMMEGSVNIPVTVKTRIGVDDEDSYDFLTRFVKTVSEAGCETFIIHARKAWLKGLSPKENREIPPLKYERVYQLKTDFPKLKFILNGGVKSVSEAETHLKCVDGVMIGRAIYQNPYCLTEFSGKSPSRVEVMKQYLSYMEDALEKGAPFSRLIQPALGLFYGQRKGKFWRRRLTEAKSSLEISRLLEDF
jgi:tRNA-dihydrouridine synthase A